MRPQSRLLPALLLLVAGCLPRPTVVEETLKVRCYSGGKAIYDGELTRRTYRMATAQGVYTSPEANWYDPEGNAVFLDADCIGLRTGVVVEVQGAPDERKRCLKRCSGVPAYRRDRCEEACPPERMRRIDVHETQTTTTS